MKFSLKKAAAAIVLAGALAVAAPTAANAYTPEGPDGTITITAGGTVTVPFTGFEPEENVTFTLTGENASAATLATVVKTAIETQTTVKTADADGNASVAVTLPANASGTYTLEAFSDSASAEPVTIAVAASSGGTGTLPNTGSDGALMLGLWVGGGALLLAGGAVVVATTVRRQRQHG